MPLKLLAVTLSYGNKLHSLMFRQTLRLGFIHQAGIPFSSVSGESDWEGTDSFMSNHEQTLSIQEWAQLGLPDSGFLLFLILDAIRLSHSCLAHNLGFFLDFLFQLSATEQLVLQVWKALTSAWLATSASALDMKEPFKISNPPT